MSKSFKISTTVFFIIVSSILQWCSLPIGNTFVWWVIYTWCLYCLFSLKPSKYNVKSITLFLIMVGISAVYGALIQAEIYWDWKNLVKNLFIYLLPVAAITFASPKLLSLTLNKYFKYLPILFLLLCFFFESDAFGRMFVPYSMLAIFVLGLKKHNIIPIAIAFAITLIFGFQSRSDVIKFCVCIALGLSLYLYRLRSVLVKLYKTFHVILLVIPFVLAGLAATNVFNIFLLEEELEVEGEYTMTDDNSEEGEASMLADTRTFIYEEEILSSITHNYFIQGRSLARGYESTAFGDEMDEDIKTNRGERYESEVAIMNIFNHFGIIGVILYFIIFVQASYKALYRSRNIFIKAVGVFVAFKWTFSWIEDFQRVDLNNLCLWIMIGMCFSPLFRSMTNRDFVRWLRSIKILPIQTRKIAIKK